MSTNPAVADLVGRSNRLGADPRNTNYAGGNTSAKGTETDPVTGQPVELVWVKGSGGDLGTLTEKNLAVLRLDRLRVAGRRLPGRGPRGRDGRRVRLLPARQGRRGTVDRHRDAFAGRRARTSTTCTPTPGSRWPPPRTGEELTRQVLRRPGGVGAVAAPRFPARAGYLRDQAGESAGDRLHPRRARHHRLGRHVGRGGGELAGDHPHRGAVPRRQRHRRSRSARSSPGSSRCPRRSGSAKAAAIFPTIRGLASVDRPQVGHYTDSDVGARIPLEGEAGPAGGAGHVLPGPLPAHQGQAAGGRSAGDGVR